jgi:hypothetical protein
MRFGWGRDNRRPQPTVVPPAASGDAFDADALTFIAAHEAASLTTMDTLQRTAINNMYLRLKGWDTSNGSDLWSLFDNTKHAIYPYAPSSDTAASAGGYSLNMVDPSAFTITWVNFVPDDFLPSGLAGNGTSKYGRTGVNILNVIGTWDFGVDVYLRNQANRSDSNAGGFLAATPYHGMDHTPYYSATDISYIGNTTVGYGTTQPTRTGLMSIQRSGTTQTKHRNGVQYDSRAVTGILPSIEIYIHARNYGGAANFYSQRNIAGIAASRPHFTAAQMADWSEIWEKYNTEIITGGRNV